MAKRSQGRVSFKTENPRKSSVFFASTISALILIILAGLTLSGFFTNPRMSGWAMGNTLYLATPTPIKTNSWSPTNTTYLIELSAASVNNAPYAAPLNVVNNTVSYNQFPVLQQRTISAVVNNAPVTVTYQDMIKPYNTQIKYSENTGGTGHGLYLKMSPTESGTGTSGLVYELPFGGSGLPVGSGNIYKDLPEIKIHGNKIVIATKLTTNGKLLIFPADNKYVMKPADTITQGSYTIKLESIGSRSSTRGTVYTLIFTVTKGTTSETATIDEGSFGTFFAEDVTVMVESIVYPTSAVVRIATAKTSFSDGMPWTVGGATTTNAEWIIARTEVVGNYLKAIKLRYGNPQNAAMKYNFDGSYLNGLAQGTNLKGPKRLDGQPFFWFKLKGLGSKSTAIDTTTVSFEASGDDTNPNTKKINTTWISRDGTSNKWNAVGFPYVAYGTRNPVAGDGIAFDLTASYPKRWTIINDKVVYFVSATLKASSTNLYDVRLRVGGESGTDVLVTNVNKTQAGTFTYGSTVNPIRCNVFADGVNKIRIAVASGYANAVSKTDSTTPMCDFYPDVVPIGKSTEITNGVPYLNMMSANANLTKVSNSSGVLVPGTGIKGWPFIMVNEAVASNSFAVVYDADAASGSYKGIQAYWLTKPATSTYIDLTGATTMINRAQQTVYDNAKYEIAATGAELSTSASNKLTAVLPEARRSSLLELNGQKEEPDTTAPSVQIRFPKNNTVIFCTSATLVKVWGTATDNDEVSKVLVRVNGGTYSAATGMYNWEKQISGLIATNTVYAMAIDASGNNKTTMSKFSCTRQRPSPP